MLEPVLIDVVEKAANHPDTLELKKPARLVSWLNSVSVLQDANLPSWRDPRGQVRAAPRARSGRRHLYPIDYNSSMLTIKRLPEFDAWLDGLRDRATRIRLARRLERAQRGNMGDVKPVGVGVFEMREAFGPGWRMYYVQRGDLLVVMLGGGDKGTQRSDIAAAKALAASLEE